MFYLIETSRCKYVFVYLFDCSCPLSVGPWYEIRIVTINKFFRPPEGAGIYKWIVLNFC